MYRHLSTNPEKYTDEDGFRKLSLKSEKLPEGVEQRYAALLYKPHHLLYLFKGDEFQFGCMNAHNGCESWNTYWALKARFHQYYPEYKLEDEDIKFLRDFGRNLKYCRR